MCLGSFMLWCWWVTEEAWTGGGLLFSAGAGDRTVLSFSPCTACGVLAPSSDLGLGPLPRPRGTLLLQSLGGDLATFLALCPIGL